MPYYGKTFEYEKDMVKKRKKDDDQDSASNLDLKDYKRRKDSLKNKQKYSSEYSDDSMEKINDKKNLRPKTERTTRSSGRVSQVKDESNETRRSSGRLRSNVVKKSYTENSKDGDSE